MSLSRRSMVVMLAATIACILPLLAACSGDSENNARVRVAIPYLGGGPDDARLVVLDFPGAHETMVVEDFGAAHVQWSSGGGYLSAAGLDTAASPEAALVLRIFDDTGSELAIMPSHGWLQPAWARERDVLAAATDDALVLLEPDGTALTETQLPGSLIDPGARGISPVFVWSPDGNRVAVATKSTLVILGLDGEARSIDLSTSEAMQADIYPAFWAGDDQIVLHAVGPPSENPEDAYRSYSVNLETETVEPRDVDFDQIRAEMDESVEQWEGPRAQDDISEAADALTPEGATGLGAIAFDNGRGVVRISAVEPNAPMTLAVAWEDIAEAIELPLDAGPALTVGSFAVTLVDD